MILKVLSSLAVLAIPAALFAQNPITADSPYQINYASNLNAGDGVINVTNSGASADGNEPIVGGNTYGDICVNAYIYAPDQEQATCCTCLVSPNSLHSWPIFFGTGNLLSNVTNGTVLNSIRNNNYSVVIKLVSTVASGIPGTASCPSPAAPNAVANGLVAWGSHSHPTNTGTVAITETPFVPATLSAGEYAKLRNDCSFNLTRGSQQVCPGCRLGGLNTALE
jgi:hypothetical protein